MWLCAEVTVIVLLYILVSLCGQKEGNREVHPPQDLEGVSSHMLQVGDQQK